MALLVNRGRAGLAAALKAQPLHLAWGRGESWWGQTTVEALTFSGAQQCITLAHAPVAEVIVRDETSSQVFDDPDDYVLDPVAGTITRAQAGLIAPNATVQVQVTYGTPTFQSDATALVDEIGRRVATSVDYVYPDSGGSIVTPGDQRWSRSEMPTRYLYVSTLFDFSEAPTEVIREVGLFVGTARSDGVPEGRLYLTPSEIDYAGYLLLLDRFAGIQRSPSARHGFSYVLVI